MIGGLAPGDELPSGSFLVDRAAVVTLRTLCGCERTLVHTDMSMLGRAPAGALVSSQAIDRRPRTRRFRIVHIAATDAYAPLSHYLYEEVSEP